MFCALRRKALQLADPADPAVLEDPAVLAVLAAMVVAAAVVAVSAVAVPVGSKQTKKALCMERFF